MKAPLRRGVWGDVGSKLLTHTQNISSQPLCIPLGRSFLVGCKKEEEQIVKPLFEEGFGEMFATVRIYQTL
ncbi:hypothetical protein DCS32_15660 [Dokdonia sp. Dokd-P16]|nr:hypothetical protein DCS32_15660 [Dokdonia sp. Dokd-P16]